MWYQEKIHQNIFMEQRYMGWNLVDKWNWNKGIRNTEYVILETHAKDKLDKEAN